MRGMCTMGEKDCWSLLQAWLFIVYFDQPGQNSEMLGHIFFPLSGPVSCWQHIAGPQLYISSTSTHNNSAEGNFSNSRSISDPTSYLNTHFCLSASLKGHAVNLNR